jgi:TRAP transporter 4TM/12TM fusion protein
VPQAARVAAAVEALCVAALTLLGIAWLLDAPLHLGLVILGPSYLAVMMGLAVAGALLAKPYRRRDGAASALDLALALAGLAAWLWAGWHHEAWLETAAERGPEKWAPAVVALVLAMEATRKHCGLALAVLLWLFVVYALVGHRLPGLFEATYSPPAKLALYLYADTNGVPGLVLGTACTLVLGFMVMGKVMERGGATAFFNNAALAAMGHRRGGAGKVEVVASSLFGTINGTTVGNIMGTGIITIPLMKAHGFRSHVAAGIEASASNGGQLAPPVMGTTAFLMAEALQIPYGEVALAAIVPALVYYWALFVQVDIYAQRHGLAGVDRGALPRLGAVLAAGWVFLLPLALLIYLLFWLGFNPGKSALLVAALLLALTIVQARRWPGGGAWWRLAVEAGRDLAPLIVICGAAGIVIGALNITGLGLQLTAILTAVAQQAGLLALLAAAAAIAIVLGMGMPTAAVYIVMAVVLAPALERMGVDRLAAHFFLFYFGLLSMLTPPVAIASYVAAGIAGADMWRTSIAGLKLGAAAYLVPFLFVYNPAILLQGAAADIAIGAASAIMSGWVFAHAVGGTGRGVALDLAWFTLLGAAAVGIGFAPVWVGKGDLLGALPSALALAAILLLARRRRTIRTTSPAGEAP